MRRPLTLPAVVLLTVTLAACGNTSPSNTSPESQDTPAALHIDPSIQGHDREVIARIMQTLDLEDRENVTYLGPDGKLYANKPELLKQAITYKRVKNNLFVDQYGRKQVFPADEPRPVQNTADNALSPQATVPSCASAGSGLYRRFYSKEGFSRETSYVQVPGSGSVFDSTNAGASTAQSTHGDTAYVYLGGWPNSGTATVDAGLQHGSATNGVEDWSPYLKGTGAAQTTSRRYASNQGVFIKFYTSSDNNLALYTSGTDTAGQPYTITLVTSVSGFPVSGAGVVMKRVSSIAQINTLPESLNTGSYLLGAYWYGGTVGTTSTNSHTWLDTDKGGGCSYISPKTTVSPVSASEETVNIDSRK